MSNCNSRFVKPYCKGANKKETSAKKMCGCCSNSIGHEFERSLSPILPVVLKARKIPALWKMIANNLNIAGFSAVLSWLIIGVVL